MKYFEIYFVLAQISHKAADLIKTSLLILF